MAQSIPLIHKLTHKQKLARLTFTRNFIKALAYQQDMEYKRLLVILGLTEATEPAATILFDYLHNGSFSATKTLAKIKCPTS